MSTTDMQDFPDWRVERWLNGPGPAGLSALRGRVVVLHTFQMLCPACVQHSLPQAQKLHRMLPRESVVVLGLHTVFEHHAVMGAQALEAFVHEYRLSFPIGIDLASPVGEVPQTMAAWGLQGTPSLLLFDRQGRLRLEHFGHLEDLTLGLALGQLLGEESVQPAASSAPASNSSTRGGDRDDDCDDAGCARP